LLTDHRRPNFARDVPAPANPELVAHVPEFYPQPREHPQGWGFAGFLTIEPGSTGRGANTMWWMGLCNCFWWIDREKGVAGFLGAQVSKSARCVSKMLIRNRYCQMVIQRSFQRGSHARRRFTIICSRHSVGTTNTHIIFTSSEHIMPSSPSIPPPKPQQPPPHPPYLLSLPAPQHPPTPETHPLSP